MDLGAERVAPPPSAKRRPEGIFRLRGTGRGHQGRADEDDLVLEEPGR